MAQLRKLAISYFSYYSLICRFAIELTTFLNIHVGKKLTHKKMRENSIVLTYAENGSRDKKQLKQFFFFKLIDSRLFLISKEIAGKASRCALLLLNNTKRCCRHTRDHRPATGMNLPIGRTVKPQMRNTLTDVQ